MSPFIIHIYSYKYIFFGYFSDLSVAKGSVAQGATAKQPVAAGVSDADADLEARLENLRRQ